MDEQLLHQALTSIFDSYHAPDQDVLVEIIQNSVDAVDERAEEETKSKKAYTPRIKVTIDTEKSSILIVDNGVGVPEGVLQALGSPHNSNKKERRKRGHKGVGLTYAAWSTKEFYFATKRRDWSKPVAGKLIGAVQWRASGKGKCPVILEDAQFARELLKGEVCGTAFKFVFPPESKVLSTLRRLKPEGIVALLQCRTAFGFMRLPELELESDDWVSNCEIEVTVDGDAIEVPGLRYLYPHEFFEEKRTLNLEKLDGLDPDKRRRLEEKHVFLYKVVPNEEVVKILSADKEYEELAELARRQHVNAYVGFADQKATIDQLNNSFYKTMPGSGRKREIIPAGIQIGTSNMPVGNSLEISMLKFGTGNKNRVLAVVEFDEVRPDFGRKTFEWQVELIAQVVVAQVLTKLLVPNRLYLFQHDTPHGNTPTEQEQSLARIREEAHGRPNLALRGLGITKEPRHEQEVVALFFALVGSGRLPGYEILSCPGSKAKYDALFDYHLPKELNAKLPSAVRVAKERFPGSGGPVKFSQKNMEFKFPATALITDFDADNKQASDLFALVCWEIGDADIFRAAGCTLTRLDEYSEPTDLAGHTHNLSMTGHKIHVICLKDVVTALAAASVS